MASVFFDTCAISAMVTKGFTGLEIGNALRARNCWIVIGRNTLYECARTYMTPHIDKANNQLLFIKNLQPEYSCTRLQLYEQEKLKLKTDALINPFCNKWEKAMIEEQHKRLLSGDRSELSEFIAARQGSVTTAKLKWPPRGRATEYKLLGSFSERIKKLPRTPETIKCIQLLFNQFGTVISLTDAGNFLNDQNSYPALRSLLYTYLYLDYSAEIHGQIPSEDRITDAMQLTEAAYCTTFVTEEKKLVRSYGNNINPNIELIEVDTFLKHLNKQT
jgi:hypothetical protein